MADDPSRSRESSPTPWPDPALQPLEALIGEWRVDLSFPGAAPVYSSMSFTWLDEGAFALMRMGNQTTDLPCSIAIIGRDEGEEPYMQSGWDVVVSGAQRNEARG